MRLQRSNICTLALILSIIAWLTGCQSAEESHTGIQAMQPALPDFSRERAEREAANLDKHKQPPDFSNIDVVTIVPAEQ